ncbi:hypothetical protein JHK87_055421 [Glycine soja]|nr:hypothetical protein JHK87_055421 [Glycine soja]
MSFCSPLGFPISLPLPTKSMATKTLEDTKPTLQDDDCVKSEIPKNDTSSGDAAIKLKDANAGDKDETSGYQVEEKKEEIDEDEEEKEEEEKRIKTKWKRKRKRRIRIRRTLVLCPLFVYAIFVLGSIADSSTELYTELAILLSLVVGIMECIMGLLRYQHPTHCIDVIQPAKIEEVLAILESCRYSGNDLHGVTTKVVDMPHHYMLFSFCFIGVEVHPKISKQFWDSRHWPKHILVRYIWFVIRVISLLVEIHSDAESGALAATKEEEKKEEPAKEYDDDIVHPLGK